MFKVSKLADYAILVLGAFNKSAEESMSASAIAHISRLPEPTVAKVLKMLTKAGLLTSTRGMNGGYRRAVPLGDMTLATVLEAVDGPLALTACVEGSNDECGFVSVCGVRGRWDDVNEAVRKALENVSIMDMVAPHGCGESQQKLKEIA
ncbi:MAG: SUF system Fe-S cluster assembly regulator [Micavibrio sp.]|nr:SUF system Fe-S cluster assembly regulator [Micavibrio sp.]